LPEAHAGQLIAHIKGIEMLSEQKLAAWRAKQFEEVNSHPVWALTEDQKTKVRNLIQIANCLPFGQALAQSEARYSVWLWNVIAKETPAHHVPIAVRPR
jgi:hypothetical protein